MSALRSFHGRKLRVEHSFDLWERIDFYESLWNGEKSLYVDYRQTKETVLSLRRFIDAQPKTLQLCHIDSIPDNFLFSDTLEHNIAFGAERKDKKAIIQAAKNACIHNNIIALLLVRIGVA